MKNILAVIILISTLISCSPSEQNNMLNTQLKNLQTELDSLKAIQDQTPIEFKSQISTFLTFQDNNAEKAMNFYISLFDNSEILDLQRWQKGSPGEVGKIMHATFSLNGSLFMCSDSPPIHEWDFSPAVSNFVDCKDDKEIERLFLALSENGQVTMPLNNYGFSQKFGWVIDKFGISWQLNLM